MENNPSNRCAVSEPVSARPASMLRILANPFTQGSLKTLHKLPNNQSFFCKSTPHPSACGCHLLLLEKAIFKLCTNSPITEVSFAYFSFQRKVRSKKSRLFFRGFDVGEGVGADGIFKRSVAYMCIYLCGIELFVPQNFFECKNVDAALLIHKRCRGMTELMG